MKTPAGKAHLERGEFLIAGVLQVIFRDDMNRGHRLGGKGNANFLLFDNVTRSKGSRTGSEP